MATEYSITPAGVGMKEIKGTVDNTVIFYKTTEHKGDDGTVLDRPSHEIIAEMFVPNPDKLEYIIHVDLNISNNESVNLKYGTEKEYRQMLVDIVNKHLEYRDDA